MACQVRNKYNAQCDKYNHKNIFLGSTIKYGPYSNIAPFTDSELVVHAENNNPMLVVTRSVID